MNSSVKHRKTITMCRILMLYVAP